MNKKVLLAIIPEPQTLRTLLDTLLKAGFASTDISIVMEDEKLTRVYAEDTGLLQGVTMENLLEHLNTLGLAPDIAQDYEINLQHNSALLAISLNDAAAEDATIELLDDYDAQEITVV